MTKQANFIPVAVIGLIAAAVIGAVMGVATGRELRASTRSLELQVQVLQEQNEQLAERIEVLETDVTNVKLGIESVNYRLDHPTTVSSPINVGTMADRLAGLDKEVEDLRSSYEANVIRPGTKELIGTFAYGVDPWDVYLTKLLLAEKAYDQGDLVLARILFLDAISSLGFFCSSWELPGWSVPPHLRDLTTEVQFTKAEPPKTYGGGDDWYKFTFKDYGC